MERISHRINWVDYCKSFAIFFVVLLHVHCNGIATQLIDGFIMPLFFFISGWLFSYERNPDYRRFAYKRFRQLVVPYLWIGIVTYIFWYFLLRNFGSNENDGVQWFMPLVGLFTGIPKFITVNTPLWALISFFTVEMIYFPLGKLKIPLWVLPLVFFSVMTCTYFLFPSYLPYLPLALGPSMAGLFFYNLGNLSRNIKWVDKYLLNIKTILIWLAVLIYAALENDRVDFFICQFNNYLFFLLSSIAGSAIVIIVSKLIGKIGSNTLIRFISETTLIVCGFHLLVFSFVKGIGYFIFGIDPESVNAGLLRGLIFAIISFAITLIIAYIIRRYFRALIDK